MWALEKYGNEKKSVGSEPLSSGNDGKHLHGYELECFFFDRSCLSADWMMPLINQFVAYLLLVANSECYSVAGDKLHCSQSIYL